MSAADPRSSAGWYAPLLFVTLTPLVTLPMTWAISWQLVHWGVDSGTCSFEGFIGGVGICPTWTALVALSPGLVNLLPVIWLGRAGAKTRAAARCATVLGGLRLIVPVGAILLGGRTATIYDSVFAPPFPGNDSFATVPIVSASLWLLTLVAIVVIAVRVRS